MEGNYVTGAVPHKWIKAVLWERVRSGGTGLSRTRMGYYKKTWIFSPTIMVSQTMVFHQSYADVGSKLLTFQTVS